jgi:hypothetical protein
MGALREEVLRLQTEVDRLRAQLADLLDANDELERRRANDLAAAEKAAAQLADLLGANDELERCRADDLAAAEAAAARKYEGAPGGTGDRRGRLPLAVTAEDDNVGGEEKEERRSLSSKARASTTTSAVDVAAHLGESARGAPLPVSLADSADSSTTTTVAADDDNDVDDSAADHPRGEVSGEDGDGGNAAPSSLAMEADSADDSPDSSTAAADEDATVQAAAPDEEGGRLDDDDEVSRGGSVEIALKASLARAIDRVRELEFRLRLQEESHESSTARMLDQQHQLQKYLRAQLAEYYDTIRGQSAHIDDQAERAADAELRHEEAMLIATRSVEASRRREGDLLTNIEELEGELAGARGEVAGREGTLIDARSRLAELEGKIRDGYEREGILVERNEELTMKVEVLELRVHDAIREAKRISSGEEEKEAGSQVVMEEGGGDMPSSGEVNRRDMRQRDVAPSHDIPPVNDGDVAPKARRRRWARAILRPWTLLSGR